MGKHFGAAVVVAVAIIVITTHRIPAVPQAPSVPSPFAPLEQQGRVAPDGPELPRLLVDVQEPATTGRTIHVPAGGDLQAALDKAAGGDRITLEPRATYRGPFRLRRKSGDGWIVIASASPALAGGRRVSPSDAAAMPRLVAATDVVIAAEPGAHHYRLVGLEIAPADGTALNTLVRLGESETSADAVPHHIIVDRCYIHGDPQRGGRRGVALNAAHSAVIDSHLSDFAETNVDAQAVMGWNGPGPFRISGNFLEASGENVMFGGADPRIRDLVPSDIEIVRNHLAKPLRWRKGHPSFAGTEWSVKNLLELKNARRVRIDGNLLEYNWPHAQNGFAILFTVRNQDGGAPWSVVEDVSFTNNLVRHVAAGINVLGRDDNHPSLRTQRLSIRNNVFLDVGGDWGGNGRFLQLLDGTADVRVEHNTVVQTGGAVFGGDHDAHERFVFQNNIVRHNDSGIAGSGTAPGTGTLERYFPGAVVRGNVFVGGPSGRYPANNLFPGTLEEIGANADKARLTLSLRKPYAGAATSGRDPGADVAALEKAMGELAGSTFRTADATPADGERAFSTGAAVLGGLAQLVFWVSAALIGYVYAGYPLVAAVRARLRARPNIHHPIQPFVSIVLVAHNEADRIAARIENLLALDYPPDRREIVVASDGSTDATVERARAFADRGVVVRAFTVRRGKAAVLSAVVPALGSEIVLFADARQRFDPQALRAIVANFADPTVGAVSGELVLEAGESVTAAGHGTAFYWKYEKFIRSMEARADSTVGATGAAYAIRRRLFEPIPEDTLLDDVLIPARIVRRGYRVVFEAKARAYDAASATAQQEFVRKTRTIAGTFQLFARERWLLNPRANRLWFETLSHKLLRLSLPVLHAALMLASIALAANWWYRWALTAQAVFYTAALVGLVQRRGGRRLPLFSVPCAICLLSWATVIGFTRFITNRQRVTWDRAATPSPLYLTGTDPSGRGMA